MKPCECKSTLDSSQLKHQRITSRVGSSRKGITVIGNLVEIEIDRTKTLVSVYRFKQWAEWFLEDQGKKENDY